MTEEIDYTPTRYDRQRDVWNQEILRKARILVLGAGTLGNEICKNLSLIGIGEITVVDFDDVEIVNLNRCVLLRERDIGRRKVDVVAEKMNALNNEVNVFPLHRDILTELGAGFYDEFDVVISGLDNREARVFANKYCYMYGVPFVDGAIEGLLGSVKVVQSPKTSCYECGFTANDYKAISKRYSCPGVPLSEIMKGSYPMVATTASIIAGIQVQEAITILHEGKSKLAGKTLRYNGYINSMDVYKTPKRDDCLGHFYIKPEIIKLPVAPTNTLSEFKEIISEELKIEEFRILNDRDVVYEISCNMCEINEKITKPLSQITKEEAFCQKCGEMNLLESSNELLEEKKTLSGHGVPSQHVLEVQTQEGNEYYIEILK